MSLDYVNKGESVKASTVNSIIDTLGGNQSMSPDLNVTTTSRGPQVSMPSKYGGPNQNPAQILELSRYMLSSWPMVAIQLGPTIKDCLNVIRYHGVNGDVIPSVSAAIVFKNSTASPFPDEISSYMLSTSDFGKDAAIHAAGWVPTMIEDISKSNYVQAQLWKFDDSSKYATIFTNIEDELSVKQELSSLFVHYGAEDSQVSGMERVDSWILESQSMLSVQNGHETKDVSTHPMVHRKGIIDAYESYGDVKVVLKATLECIDVEKEKDPETDEEKIVQTTWAWKVPLGIDAYCDEGKAYTECLTYGGNPVVFEVEEESGDEYTGEATYEEGSILYGKFEVDIDDPIEPGELWIKLSYDYENHYVKAEFSDEPDDGTYEQDGILNRNILVASIEKFKTGQYVVKGSVVPQEKITYGTWGILTKDGPKLDSYCKKDSSTEFKSLDWADHEGEDVECQCAELYKFDQLEVVEPSGDDHIIIRRPDELGGAEIQYISLSSLSSLSGEYNPPDANVEDAQTSSLQTRQLYNGSTVEEMFNFHLSDTVDVSISDLTSVDIVIRNPNDGQPYLEYGRLCIDIVPDTKGEHGQRSIDWLSDTHELQLYKFDEEGLSNINTVETKVNDASQPIIPDDYEFVFRKGGPGGEIEYGKIQLSVGAELISGDSQTDSEQKSISVENNIVQLYKMGEAGQVVSAEVPICFDEPQPILSSDWEFVVRKGGPGGEIDYAMVNLKQAQLSVDKNATQNQKSIQYANLGDGSFLEMYNFHSPGEAGSTVEITSSLVSLLPNDYELVVRKNGAGGQISYTKLSAVIAGAPGSVKFDTEATQNQKSLEWKTQGNVKYAQLYKIDAAGEETEQVNLKFAKHGFQDLLPDNEEFVIRTGAGGEIQYKNIGVCLSAYLPTEFIISGDSQASLFPPQRSIDLMKSGNDYYYQLHDMDKVGVDLLVKTIETSATTILPWDYEFVLRHNGAGGTIQFANLSCLIPETLPPISGDANVIPNVSRSIATGVDQQGNTWHQLYNLGSTGVISATLAYDGYDHYIMNEGNMWSNDRKQFLYYDLDDKCLKYADICLIMPKVTASDLDDDVIPEISGVIGPEISGLISAELSALDDKYWIKGEDESENYGSAIGDSGGNKVIDLDNKELVGTWSTPNDFTCNAVICDQVLAGGQLTLLQGGVLQIGNTTLNESQLQQLLALL